MTTAAAGPGWGEPVAADGDAPSEAGEVLPLQRRPPAAHVASGDQLGGTEVSRSRRQGYRIVKRGLDVVAAALLLVLLLPTMLMIALAVRLTSRGPVLFRQERCGHGGRPFEMLKFRSMRVDCDDEVHRRYVTALLTQDAAPDGGAAGVYKLTRDPRVTPLGRLLRRTSLDELPQLLNVLRGDMSLVGPRPALPWEVELYDSHHRRRLEVPPGLTGLWQVSGRSLLTMRQALELDVAYVDRCSTLLDLRILLRTPAAVCRRSSAR